MRKKYRGLDEIAPITDIARILCLTERQYSNIYMLTRDEDDQDKGIGNKS